MKAFKIAVMSDWHVGAARSRDLYPPENIPDPKEVFDDNYIKEFVKYVRTEGIAADYLVIPGDITNGAVPCQVKLAREVIIECAAALGVVEKNIFVVPGNHDVDWSILKIPDSTGHYKSLRYQPFLNPNLGFAPLIKGDNGSLFEDPFLQIWSRDDLLIVGFNSAWGDGPGNNNHPGGITDKHLSELEKYLSAIPRVIGQGRIFITHHHPIAYSDPTNHPDFSAMQNSENLISLLKKYKFDLLIHGHKHNPRLTIDTNNYSRPLIILASGSFSAIIFSEWRHRIANQFHILNCASREPETDAILGELTSWSYVPGLKWVPSNINHGIEHRMPFGLLRDKSQLKKDFKEIIGARITGRGYIQWKSILADFPIYANLSLDQILEILNSLSDELNFDVMRPSGDELFMLERKSI